MLNDEQRELLVFLLITILAALIFSFALFGLAGTRVVLGIVFISLPFYLIINNFEFTEGEKFVFSILFGLTLFSALVYILGLVISFKISIIITFIVLIIVAFFIRKFKVKKLR